MTDANAFTKLVPGFDFLQGLVKNAGAALPGIGQWVAPTLNPEEIEKRIEELRTVQFWLEQNARMLGATIQALEVQRMTLSTLKTMNVQMSDLRDSMRLRDPSEAQAAPNAASRKANAGSGSADSPVSAGVVDPMQWWGALTKQFTQLAAGALKDSATDSAKNLAGAMVKQGFDAAEQTLKSAVSVPMKAASGMARAAGGVAGGMANAAKVARNARAARTEKSVTATDAGSTSGGGKPRPGARGRGARKATG